MRGGAEKKARLRTSQDVYNRLMWDNKFDPKLFTIGYMDRFDGMMELPVSDFVPIDKGGDIAYHRIFYYRQGANILWDRTKRIDKIFGSGEAAGQASGSRHFLLMKHRNRYDLPKGHIEPGETDQQCALRETKEETGINAEVIKIDSRFSYSDTYYPEYRRFGGARVEKTVRIFLGFIADEHDEVVRDATTGLPVVQCTEHGGYEWVVWNPPHNIQKAIDPLLKAANQHFKKTKQFHCEEQANDEEEEEEEEEEAEAEEETTERKEDVVALIRTEEKDTAERARQEKSEREREAREKRLKRQDNYNSRKKRRQRNAVVSGGGYALLDKVPGEHGRAQVGIYEDTLVFDERALNAQAKLILKRNDKTNKRISPSAHKYDEDASEEEELDEETSQYYAPKQTTTNNLGDFMSPTSFIIPDSQDGERTAAFEETTPKIEQDWDCPLCTCRNKATFLVCDACGRKRT